MPPLHEALSRATAQLTAAGVPQPDEDARELAAHVLALPDPEHLATVRSLAADEAAAFAALVARRADRVPLPHLTGRVRFHHIELLV